MESRRVHRVYIWMVVGGPIVASCARVTMSFVYLSGDQVTEAITSMSMLWLMHFVSVTYFQTSAVIAVLVYAVTMSVNRTPYRLRR